MCSFAVWRVKVSFSFCEMAWASWPLVSSSFSSRRLDPPRALLQPPAEDGDLFLGLPGRAANSVSRSSLRSPHRPAVVAAFVDVGRRNHLARVLGPCRRPYTGATPTMRRSGPRQVRRRADR